MQTRHLLVSSIAALALAAAPALHASPLSITNPVHAAFSKTRLVQINLRNMTGGTLDLKVGDDLMKVETGKTISLKVPAGTRVVSNTATPNHIVGELLVEAQDYLNGATISIAK